MIRCAKEIRLQSLWTHMESLDLKLSPDDEIAFWAAACAEAAERQPRPNSRYVDMELMFYDPDAWVVLSDKTLVRFRTTVGPRLFDRVLGDWPFDKIDVWAIPEDVKELNEKYKVTGVSLFVWRH